MVMYEARISLNGRFQFLARSEDKDRAESAAQVIVDPAFHDEILVISEDDWVYKVRGYEELKSILRLKAVTTAQAIAKGEK